MTSMKPGTKCALKEDQDGANKGDVVLFKRVVGNTIIVQYRNRNMTIAMPSGKVTDYLRVVKLTIIEREDAMMSYELNQGW